MKYPKLTEIPTTRELVDVFKGYNHNLRIGAGEFYDTKNLSADYYPVLSTRKKRGILSNQPTNLMSNIIDKDGLTYLDGNTLVCGDERIYLGNDITFNRPQKLISMGANVVIFPDFVVVNTITKEVNKPGYLYGGASAYFALPNGDDVGAFLVGERDNFNYSYHVDPKDAVVYNPKGEYCGKASTKLLFGNKWFKKGDLVSITVVDGYNGSVGNMNGNWEISYADETGIIIPTFIMPNGYYDGKEQNQFYGHIEAKINIPTLDFIIESENRLWGCHYGEVRDTMSGEVSSFVNEIYASALGDPMRWINTHKISTDPYTVQLGSDGAFTGAITYMGHPMFFKENCVHVIYGNYPSNYNVQTTALRGVESGCHESLAIVDEVLYYKSRSGICAYNGSLPVEISAALGEKSYANASAGTIGSKYYVSMKESGKEDYYLFSYDTKKGIWFKEDKTQVTSFCKSHGDLYFLDYDDNKIKSIRGTGIQEYNPIEWMAETGMIGIESIDKKVVSRIDIRMQLNLGTRVHFFAEYDSSGEWKHLFSVDGVNLNTVPIPIRPVRCDHMRIRLVGVGDAKIFSLCKYTE
jgi:hypothetical protein